MSDNQEPFDQLPDAIVERLRARDRSVAVLTPAVDRAVRDAACHQFAPRHRRAAAGRRWQIPAAAAAAVALAVLVIGRPFAPGGIGIESARLTDDVDGSGRVDVLDAFALARGRAADPDAVSQQRIDELTDRIVRLSRTENAL